MTYSKLFIIGLVLGFSTALAPSCGQAKKCDASNCTSGCCDATGLCQVGNTSEACGAAGNQCNVCTAQQMCAANACVPLSTNTGGGTGTGGGSAGAGGGAGGGSAVMGTSCSNAIALQLGGSPGSGDIDVSGKRVYFSVAVEANDNVVISTEANPNEEADTLDTVVSLYDTSGGSPVLMAAVDDSFPRISTDTVFAHRFIATGTYCLAVEDYSSWVGQPKVPTTNHFSVAVRAVDPQASGTTIDAENNNDIASAQTGTLLAGTSQSGVPFQVGVVYGLLNSDSDVDVYKLTVANDHSFLSVAMPPLGAPAAPRSGYGSGLPTISLRVLKADGTVIGGWSSSASSVATMPQSIDVAVSSGDVFLFVERPAGSVAGTNDFYATSVDIQPDNPLEMNDSTNGDIATPETLNFEVAPQDAKTKRAFILGTIGTGDTDYYAVPVLANDSVGISCGALRTGSGLTATYELVTETGTSLQTDAETATKDIFWGDSSFASQDMVTAVAAGTLRFKVTGTQNPAITGNWYRCAVRVVSP